MKWTKEYRKEYMKEYDRKKRLKIGEHLNKINKGWRLKNKEYLKKYDEKRNKSNERKEYREKYNKEYLLNNRGFINAQRRKKVQNDLNFKLTGRLRCRLYFALKGRKKEVSAVKNLGISIKELKIYLAKKFYPHSVTGEKMTWDNYGYRGWHIDHKIPCASFDLTDPEQQKKCCHYTNLQPLWAFDNMSKGKKIISGDITSPKM